MKPVIDSQLSFDECLSGTAAPAGIIADLRLAEIRYFSFDGRLHQGQLVIHKSALLDIAEVFEFIEKSGFPVEKAIPIVRYGWSDDASMADNNTSAFNYRKIAGKDALSNHAWGLAVDINPRQNPFIDEDGIYQPEHSFYNPRMEGTFHDSHPVLSEFVKRGWRWGGNFKEIKDYHHFEKTLAS